MTWITSTCVLRVRSLFMVLDAAGLTMGLSGGSNAKATGPQPTRKGCSSPGTPSSRDSLFWCWVHLAALPVSCLYGVLLFAWSVFFCDRRPGPGASGLRTLCPRYTWLNVKNCAPRCIERASQSEEHIKRIKLISLNNYLDS
jgi:hypothetical protein